MKGRIVGYMRKEPLMVEQLSGTCGRKKLLVARTLACGGRETVQVEVMNPSAEDVYLYKGTHEAMASPVQGVAEEWYSEPNGPAGSPCGGTEDRRDIKGITGPCERDDIGSHVPYDTI